MAVDRMSKVYIVAYGCEPGLGSEAEVGWQTALGLKACGVDDITVVTRLSNAKAISASPESSHLDFVYLESRPWVKLKPHGKFSYIYYFFWQLCVWKYLRRRVNPDDIVHLVTFGNILLPTFVDFLNCKLILGPMGGGAAADSRLMTRPSLVRRLAFAIQRVEHCCFRFMPHARHLVKKADVIMVRTSETLDILPKFCRNKAEVVLETGVAECELPPRRYGDGLRRIITVSRLIDTKNVDQVIEIYSLLREKFPELAALDIVGDGPLLPALKRRYGDVPGVAFLGKVAHDGVRDLLMRSDLFLFASIKEGGSHALFEAAAAGLPIACYDVSGMSVFPPEGGAIKVVPKPRDVNGNVSRLAEEIARRFRNGDAVEKMAHRLGLCINSHYIWSSKCLRYKEYYNSTISEKK